MRAQPKDIVASIYGRLTNEARKQNKPFGEILQYYGMERFLYRLSKTQYASSLILKGGLVFYGWELPLRRPTRDIDFLGTLQDQQKIIQQVIVTALSIPFPEDGMTFDPSTLSVIETHVDTNHAGIQVKFVGYLGRIQIPIHIDFGFSDELTSKAVTINYPTLLKEMPHPQLISYPIESVVAEKFQTMEKFVSIPSRWKDYYDIWLISEHFELDSQSLQKAIAKTFVNRSTDIPHSRPISLTIEFASKYQEDWESFLNKSGLENDEIVDFKLLVEYIWGFLEMPLEELLTPDIQQKNRKWSPSKKQWR